MSETNISTIKHDSLIMSYADNAIHSIVHLWGRRFFFPRHFVHLFFRERLDEIQSLWQQLVEQSDRKGMSSDDGYSSLQLQ